MGNYINTMQLQDDLLLKTRRLTTLQNKTTRQGGLHLQKIIGAGCFILSYFCTNTLQDATVAVIAVPLGIGLLITRKQYIEL